MDLVVKDEKYLLLVEQIKATISEAVHTSRWVLVEGYWLIGQLIRQDFPQRGITKALQGLAVDTQISERTLWYAVQFYDKYPDIQKLPEGKNITWNKLITKYLTEPKEIDDTCNHKWVCVKCKLQK